MRDKKPSRLCAFRLVPESEDMLTIDFVRFLAAECVVIFHFGQGIISHEHLAARAGTLDFLSLFVDVFFIISGFVIATIYNNRMTSRRDYLGFMQKRFARIGPLHWLTLLFIAGMGAFLLVAGRRSNFQNEYDWSCFAPQLLFLHALGACHHPSFNFPSWSISAEMTLYVAFPLFLTLARRQRSSLIALTVMVLGAMYVFSGGPGGDQARGWTNWTTQFGAIRGVAGFSLGVALYAYHDHLRLVRMSLPLLLASLAAFFGLGFSGVHPMWLAPLAYAIAFFAIVNDLGRRRSAAVRKLAPLGQLTYSIYMLHVPVRMIMVALVGEHLLHLHGVAYILWSVVAVFLLLPISWISLILFERPARKWVGGLGRGRRQPVTLGTLAGESPLQASADANSTV